MAFASEVRKDVQSPVRQVLPRAQAGGCPCAPDARKTTCRPATEKQICSLHSNDSNGLMALLVTALLAITAVGEHGIIEKTALVYDTCRDH